MADQSSPAVRVDAAVDGDEFMLSVPGAGGELVRTGEGSDATRVSVQSASTVQVALLEFGFPMVGTAHSEGDHLILCQMLRTPPGGRWDGTELSEGQVFVYPPGSMQVAQDPEGLCFGMVVVPWEDVELAAGALDHDIAPAARQHVRHHGPDLSALFAGLVGTAVPHSGSAPSGPAPELMAPDRTEPDQMLEAVVRIACQPLEVRATRARRRWESQDLVADAVDWLSANGLWQVPMLTLCRAVGVSERRLQTAFREVFDMTPTSFVRLRALQAAHRALVDGRPGAVRVSEVSAAHGFAHRGRFAALYSAVYGRPPGSTLRDPRMRPGRHAM